MREWCESGDKDRQGEKGEIGACFRWAGFDSAAMCWRLNRGLPTCWGIPSWGATCLCGDGHWVDA
jgi:hypothetical protein